MLGRTTDKARASNAETLSDYDYGCPLDRAVLTFLGITPEDYADAVASLSTDEAVADWVRRCYLAHKSKAEIDQWNRDFVLAGPRGLPEGHAFRAMMLEDRFVEYRNSVAPHRPDVWSFADVLDLDEQRQVPERSIQPKDA